jgi:hypothetical protein
MEQQNWVFGGIVDYTHTHTYKEQEKLLTPYHAFTKNDWNITFNSN